MIWSYEPLSSRELHLISGNLNIWREKKVKGTLNNLSNRTIRTNPEWGYDPLSSRELHFISGI